MPLPFFPIGELPTGLTAAEASKQRSIVLFGLLILFFLDIESESGDNPFQTSALDMIVLIGLTVILFANGTPGMPGVNPRYGCPSPGKCGGEEGKVCVKALQSPEESDGPAQPEAQEAGEPPCLNA